MSETAPEAPPRSSRGGKITQTLTTRIGPLPMWVWVVIAGGILVAWRLYASKQQAATQDTSATDTGVPADQVPQFVNQVYTSPNPPGAPVPGPPGPTGPPGPQGPGPGPNVVIPDVKGLSGAQAYQVLRSQALAPGPGGVNPKRIVLRTNPPAGKQVPKHTNVTVTFK